MQRADAVSEGSEQMQRADTVPQSTAPAPTHAALPPLPLPATASPPRCLAPPPSTSLDTALLSASAALPDSLSSPLRCRSLPAQCRAPALFTPRSITVHACAQCTDARWFPSAETRESRESESACVLQTVFLNTSPRALPYYNPSACGRRAESARLARIPLVSCVTKLRH